MKTNVAAEFYVCSLRLENATLYIIWFSDDKDGVWSDGSVVWFWPSELELRRFAERQGISLSNEVSAVYDLDMIGAFAWGGKEIDAQSKLDAWNLMMDVASSVHDVDFLKVEGEQNDVYNHLFYLSGCAPVRGVEPEGLTAAENETVRRVLLLGLELLRKRLTPCNS